MGTSVSTPFADMYLKVQSAKQGFIKGESTAADHEDEIVVKGWKWGLAQNTDAANRSQVISKRSLRPLVITKQLDVASTKLMSALSNNETIKTAVLAMRVATGAQADYTIITLTNALVIEVECLADHEGEVSEEVTFSFSEVDIQYRPTKNGLLGAAVSFSDKLS